MASRNVERALYLATQANEEAQQRIKNGLVADATVLDDVISKLSEAIAALAQAMGATGIGGG